MILPISFKQMFRDMRKQKLRTIMTTFGILWGTMSIVLLMGFGTGLQEYNQKRFRGLGENIAIIWPGITSMPHQGLPRGRRIRFSEEDIWKMKRTINSIKRISPEYARWNVTAKAKRNNKLIRVAGVWPEFGEMRNILPQMGGRFINSMDMAEKRRVIFLGDELAADMFGNDNPIGKSLLVNNVPFTVIGIMKEKDQSSSYSGRDRRQSWIPSTTFRTMWSYRYPNQMIAQSQSVASMPATMRSIKEFLGAKYKFNPEDTEALFVWDTTETFKFFLAFFAAFKYFLVGIGCMTLITGGIGVTNIMNVVLEERTKEIGIKMAVGAKKRVIMAQFMIETIVLTAIGGLLGFGLGVGVMKIIPPEMMEHLGQPQINTAGALMAIGVLGIVAITAGFFPARRAASLEPVTALKLF